MAQDKPKTPQETFSEIVTQWERNYDAFANQVMGTEGFSQAMNEMQKNQLGYQRMLAQTMSEQMAALNIPSREDILNLADAIHQMDRRLERIEEKLAVSSPSSSARKRPPRTKQPPTAEAGESPQPVKARKKRTRKNEAK